MHWVRKKSVFYCRASSICLLQSPRFFSSFAAIGGNVAWNMYLKPSSGAAIKRIRDCLGPRACVSVFVCVCVYVCKQLHVHTVLCVYIHMCKHCSMYLISSHDLHKGCVNVLQRIQMWETAAVVLRLCLHTFMYVCENMWEKDSPTICHPHIAGHRLLLCVN